MVQPFRCVSDKKIPHLPADGPTDGPADGPADGAMEGAAVGATLPPLWIAALAPYAAWSMTEYSGTSNGVCNGNSGCNGAQRCATVRKDVRRCATVFATAFNGGCNGIPLKATATMCNGALLCRVSAGGCGGCRGRRVPHPRAQTPLCTAAF
eukprot:gene23875-biopygen13404